MSHHQRLSHAQNSGGWASWPLNKESHCTRSGHHSKSIQWFSLVFFVHSSFVWFSSPIIFSCSYSAEKVRFFGTLHLGSSKRSVFLLLQLMSHYRVRSLTGRDLTVCFETIRNKYQTSYRVCWTALLDGAQLEIMYHFYIQKILWLVRSHWMGTEGFPSILVPSNTGIIINLIRRTAQFVS